MLIFRFPFSSPLLLRAPLKETKNQEQNFFDYMGEKCSFFSQIFFPTHPVAPFFFILFVNIVCVATAL